MDLPTGPGLFIDDNDWFRPARTSPFRPAGKSCVRRHSRGYSRSAEQQSHITRALCTGSARGRVRTCMEVPDPGRASRRGYIQSVFHGSLSDLDDRDRLASRPISAQNHGELGQIASRSPFLHLVPYLCQNRAAESVVFGRGGRAKAGPLGVPFAANPRRGKGVK